MSKNLDKKDDKTLMSLGNTILEFSVDQHPEFNESFLQSPSKVQEVIECLETIENANKMDSAKVRRKSTVDGKSPAERKSIVDPKTIVEGRPSVHRKPVGESPSFLVSKRSAQPARGSFRRSRLKKLLLNTNQFTFMRQVEPEAEDRTLARLQRESVAETFRRMGNYEYRKLRFDVAINHYTKGMTYIKDSPVLYVNRAMCYIKLREYKRSIIDCDYVLTYLDEKYVRAWLYRAAAFKRLNDEANYEHSVAQARRLNHTETEFIDDFLDKMRTLL